MLVVNIVGALSKNNIVIFKQCQELIARSGSKCVILNFRDVPPSIDSEFFTIFDELKTAVQRRAGFIRFSGLCPDLRQVFLARKVAESSEVTNNLTEALQSFPMSHTHAA